MIILACFDAFVNFVQRCLGCCRKTVHLRDGFKRRRLPRNALDECLGAHGHESARLRPRIFATLPFLLVHLDLLDKLPLMLVHHHFDWSDNVSLLNYFGVVIFLQHLGWNFLVMMVVVVRALRLLLGNGIFLRCDESIYARVLNDNIWLLF